MKQALLAAFERDISTCIIETSEQIIEVYEGEDLRSYIKTEKDSQDTHFQLNNLNNELINFAALDNCIMLSSDSKRCDFIIGNFSKLFFVEIKKVEKGSRRSNAKKAAILQLIVSINLLQVKIDLTKTNLVAVICIVNKKEAYPKTNADKLERRVKFKETHGADLLVGQSANF